MKPDISFIIPCYNCEKFIQNTIESIIHQSHAINFEIILIDDGSSDGTLACLKEISNQQHDFPIYVLSQKNSGPGSARNQGLSIANGEYVLFVDSDDMLLEKYVERLYAGINGMDFCFGAYYRVIDNKNKVIVHSKIKCHSAELLLNYFIGGKIYISLWNSIFKSSIIKKYDIKFKEKCFSGEDELFIMNYLLHCNKINYIKEPLYEYHFDTKKAYERYKKYMSNIPANSIYWNFYQDGLTLKRSYCDSFDNAKFPRLATLNLVDKINNSVNYQSFFDLNPNSDIKFVKNCKMKYLPFSHFIKIKIVYFLYCASPKLLYSLIKKDSQHE